MIDISKKLSRLVYEKDLTIRKLAERTELSCKTVHRVLNGQPCFLSTLEKICQALEVNLKEIL